MHEILFPHESIRKGQHELILATKKAIETKSHLVVHAPTGLGKTAATLSVALAHALNHNKTVFFLTSRHTQHAIAVETLRQIQAKHSIQFTMTDIIGKQHMCIQPGAHTLRDFNEYCKNMKEHRTCEYYENTKEKNSLSVVAKNSLHILSQSPVTAKNIIENGRQAGICPYEMSLELAKTAQVIVADYYYIFHPTIQDNFFSKSGISLENCIIIVDEAHNLPNRIRELLTDTLSTGLLGRALKEAELFNFAEAAQRLTHLHSILKHYCTSDEQILDRSVFIQEVERLITYEKLVEDFEYTAAAIKETQPSSAIGAVGQFLTSWLGNDDGFSRILTRKERGLTLTYRCLDPDVLSRTIITGSHSTIMMSGTLSPTTMYKDVLGCPQNTHELTLLSPFPESNRLSLIIPQTSTKFSLRSNTMYEKIAHILAKVTTIIPGNCALFFPSYQLRDDIAKYYTTLSTKTVFSESPGMSTDERNDLLERFKQYKSSGATLLGVSAGSFSEGIDLPGDLLKCVIVIGLPLRRPDLETKELIQYYDRKCSKGWDYGYVFPAFNKCLQSAGRCIRSETDRGVIIFLDERFSWANYYKCFPKDLNVKISSMYEERIRNFYDKN